MTTLSAGKYTYELIEGWAKLPEGWVLGQTGIMTDSQDRVYLFNRSAHPTVVLDRDGNFLTSWGEGVLTDAHCGYIDSEDNLYLPVREANIVLKYNTDGKPPNVPGHPGPTVGHRLVGKLPGAGEAGGRPLQLADRRGHSPHGGAVYLRWIWELPGA